MEDVKKTVEGQDTIDIKGVDVKIPAHLLQDETNEPKSDDVAPKDPVAQDTGQPVGQPTDDDERFKGKTNEELIQIIRDSQRHISKLTNDKKSGDVNPLDSIKADLGKVSSDIHNIKQSMSAYDADEDRDDPRYKQLKKDLDEKTRMYTELTEKETEYRIRDTVNKALYEQQGEKFLAEQRGKVATHLGLEAIDDDTWQAISGHAMNIAGLGNSLTEEDVVAGAIKTLGSKVYTAMVSTNAKHTVRDDIKQATAKTVLNVGNKQLGRTFAELSEKEHLKILDHLYKTDRVSFEKYSEKLKKL
jgi:hypothetical protein